MKLLLDQGLPRSSARLLRSEGIDSIHVGEIGMAKATDVEIIQKASNEGRIVITLDADFHTLLALSRAVLPSIVRIRIEGLKTQAMTDLLLTVITECNDDLIGGSAVTVEPSRIRIRRLPLVPPNA